MKHVFSFLVISNVIGIVAAALIKDYADLMLFIVVGAVAQTQRTKYMSKNISKLDSK